MAEIIKPPQPLVLAPGIPSIFLAGSIEMGASQNWQATFEQALTDQNVTILNPRRDEWDASWVQSIDNSQFRAQVEWELAAQEQADTIVMYFEPSTKSPITLLELGLFARSGRLIVCCPRGFWRRGNVEVVCHRYGVPMVDDLKALISAAKLRLWD